MRPPLANDRLSILDDGNVRLEFKRPRSDGDGRGDLSDAENTRSKRLGTLGGRREFSSSPNAGYSPFRENLAVAAVAFGAASGVPPGAP